MADFDFGRRRFFSADLEVRQERRHHANNRFRGSAQHALSQSQTAQAVHHAWERVNNNWSVIADDPGGITDLRQTSLHLAVRGRLVNQDGSEESPRILTTHRQIHSVDGPFVIPPSWRWARFDQVADSRLGKMLDTARNTGSPRPYLRNANVQWFRFELTEIKTLRLESRDLETHAVREGDLVVCEGGEPGRAAVCDATVDGMVFQKALHRVRPRQGMNVWYLAYLLRCYAYSGFLASFFTGATIKHLTGRSLKSVPVPVPPSAEQDRIVDAVKSLMTACNRLESALVRRNEDQDDAADVLSRIA